MTIIEFINARLDEAEEAARTAAEVHLTPWYYEPEDEHTWDAEDLMIAGGVEVAPHIALHDPGRVLRDVRAKRKILERHPHRRFAQLPDHWPDHWRAETPVAFPGTSEPYIGCRTCDYDRDWEQPEPGDWCDYIKDIANVYADHPDFKKKWAP